MITRSVVKRDPVAKRDRRWVEVLLPIRPNGVRGWVPASVLRIHSTPFRIVIDIAIKALSPAINDPTTAVIAIDQLQRLLHKAGIRNLRTDEISDKSGQLAVIFRTPNWEDFVHLAFTEIRHCGAQNMQIARRLRAMIENLIQTLPKHRHPALQQQLQLLDREIEKYFVLPEDLALARMADSQGLGGASGVEKMQ